MLPTALLKSTPEDFVVEEIPSYEPSGTGEHLYLRFTKRNMTTDAAVRAIGAALKVSSRDIGVAGMKDKVAVTTQTISIQPPRLDAEFDTRARALELDGITIHEAKRHGNKLKTGHLKGNRFAIVVRELDPAAMSDVDASFAKIAREGVPNAFGEQRFGRAKDNAERALAWLSGKASGPRDPKMKRLLWSSLQSALFNAVLDARVADGSWCTALDGDVMKKHDTGGLYVCEDVQAERDRAARGDVSPTGPIVGVKMRAAERDALLLEAETTKRVLGDTFDLDATKTLGEGTRRALRLWVEELKTARDGDALRIEFVLPKGSYATTVLGAVFSLREPELRRESPAAEEMANDGTNLHA